MTDSIKISFPCKTEYLTMVRLTTASIASTMGFDLDAIDDLRVCVSEAINKIIYQNDTIDIEFLLEDNKLSIDVYDERGVREDCTDKEMGMMILESLMDKVVCGEKGIHLEKMRKG